MGKSIAGTATVLLLALVGGGFPAPRCADAAPTRIYVVAIHDSSLFTFCPPALRAALASDDLWRAALAGVDSQRAAFASRGFGPARGDSGSFQADRYRFYVAVDGRLVFPPAIGRVPPPYVPAVPGALERSRPDWGVLSTLAKGVCPSGWVDFGMRKEIESEFKNRKDYELVDSAEEAEFVLVVEALYYTYWDPVSGGRANYSVTDDTRAGFGRHLRQSAVAVLVPAETYRRAPADSEAILQAALWTGASFDWKPSFDQVIHHGVDPYLNSRSASIKELVSRFVKRSKWDSDVPPVSPAWSLRPGGAPDADSGKRALTVGESERRRTPAEKTGRAPAANVIRTETVLVTVPVIASDENGAYVPDLSIEDVHVYENGIEQKIDRLIDEAAPIHTALLMDTSRSTLPARADIESAALAFLGFLRPEDELMAVSLSNWIHVDFEFTLDRSRLRGAIADSAARARAPYIGADTTKEPRQISPGAYRGTYSSLTNEQLWMQGRFDGTRLYDALDLTVTERLDKIAGRKAILLFTDGVDTGSRLATAESTLARIEESDVLVYVIRYNPPMPKTPYRIVMDGTEQAYARGAQYLQALADQSGGRLLNASAGADLQPAFSYVAGELRHQYTLCYYPAGPLKDGSFRRIQVTVDRPGVKVRARPGYRVIR